MGITLFSGISNNRSPLNDSDPTRGCCARKDDKEGLRMTLELRIGLSWKPQSRVLSIHAPHLTRIRSAPLFLAPLSYPTSVTADKALRFYNFVTDSNLTLILS